MGQVDREGGRRSSVGRLLHPTHAALLTAWSIVAQTAWGEEIPRSSSRPAPATVSRADFFPTDEVPQNEVSRARFDTVDGPLPAFRISLRGRSSSAMVDPQVTPAGHHEPASHGSNASPIRLVSSSPDKSRSTHAANELPVPLKGSPTNAEPLPILPPPADAVVVPAPPTVPGPPVNTPPKPSAGQAEVAWPTVIYRSPTVVLFVPDELRPYVERISLERVSPGGERYRKEVAVVNAQGVFESLAAGAYEVTYLADDQLKSEREVPTRRILVELETVPSPSAWGSPTRPTSAQDAVLAHVDDGLYSDTESTWELLGRGASYSALRRFQEIVIGESRAVQGADESTDIQRLLSGQVSIDVLEKSGEFTREEIAERWAKQLGQRLELSSAMYGLGRAYEMIEAENRPLVAGTGRLAELCYQTAHLLDPAVPGPLRDLGLRLLDQGMEEEAGVCLREAAQSAPDAETLMALGQWYARMKKFREAAAAFEEAHRLDPQFLQAALERARWSLSPSTGALYPKEIQELSQLLARLAASNEVSMDDRRWAAEGTKQIAWLTAETRANAQVQSPRVAKRLPPASPVRTNAVASSARKESEASPLPTRSPQVVGKIPVAIKQARTVARAIAPHGAATHPVPVRTVATNGSEDSNRVVPLGTTNSVSATASTVSVPIPRADERPRTNSLAGANSETPVRIPHAVSTRSELNGTAPMTPSSLSTEGGR